MNKFATPAQLRLLREMNAGADVIAEGITAYSNYRRISRRTLIALLRCGAISVDNNSGAERFAITSIGRAACVRPEILAEASAAFYSRKNFDVVDNHIRFEDAGAEPAKE